MVRTAVVLGLLVVGLLLVWWLYDLTSRGLDLEDTAVEAIEPPESVHAFVIPPTVPPTTIPQRVRAASVSRPPAVHGTGACGGDLPPCHVMRCESGGNIRAENPRSSASGKWQIIDGTWARFEGYARALHAPEEVQDAKARLLWAGGRGAFHWRSCL